MNVKKFLRFKCIFGGKIKDYQIESMRKELKDDKSTLTKLKNLKERYEVEFYQEEHSCFNKIEFKQLNNTINLIEKLIRDKNKAIRELEFEADKQEGELEKYKRDLLNELNDLDDKSFIKYIVYFNFQYKEYKKLEEYKDFFAEKLTEYIVLDKRFKNFKAALDTADELYAKNDKLELKYKIDSNILDLCKKFL